MDLCGDSTRRNRREKGELIELKRKGEETLERVENRLRFSVSALSQFASHEEINNHAFFLVKFFIHALPV